MDAKSIIAALDAEIEALRQARALLLNNDGAAATATKAAGKPQRAVKRVLSPEARQRIADAQRKRWAAARKPKKAATHATPAKAAKAASKKSTRASAKKAAPKKAAAVKAKSVAKKAGSVKTEPAKTEAGAS